jgi:hypothetical protein
MKLDRRWRSTVIIRARADTPLASARMLDRIKHARMTDRTYRNVGEYREIGTSSMDLSPLNPRFK